EIHGAIAVNARGAVLQDLHVLNDDPNTPGVAVREGASATLNGLIVGAAQCVDVEGEAGGSRLILESATTFALAIRATGMATFDHLIVEDATGEGVLVSGALSLERFVLGAALHVRAGTLDASKGLLANITGDAV